MDNKYAKVVKYDNQLNTLALGKLNPVELDLFLTICAFAREQQSQEVELSFSTIKEMSNYTVTQKKRFVAELTQTNKKLMNLDFELVSEDNTVITQFVLFPVFKTDTKKKTLTVSVNPEFSFLLNDLTANFTRFELKEFIEIRSKYSKILYQLLKQYRKTGALIISIEEFRRLLDIPDGYRMSEIDRRVLTPAMSELSNYFVDLGVKKVTAKTKGNPVVQLQFYFQKESGENVGNQKEYKKWKEQQQEKEKNAVDVEYEEDFIYKALNNVPEIE